jgi:preprotein translocase subunit SecD
MRLSLASLLLMLALAGCRHAAVSPPAPAGPATLTLSLRALPDDALDYHLTRMARDIEKLFARNGEQADVDIVGHAALRVVLRNGMRKISWPALLALDGLAPPTEKPEWSADFQLPVATSWLAAAREQILDETVTRLRDRLVIGMHHPSARVSRQGDRVRVEVSDLPVSARAALLEAVTVRTRLTFHLVDSDTRWMRWQGGRHAHDGLTLEEAPSPSELFWRASDEAPLRLFVDSLHGEEAVPSDHRLLVGDLWRRDGHFFRTFFVHRRVELSSEDITESFFSVTKARDRIDALKFTLTPWGTQRFADLTAHNVGAKLVVVIEPLTQHQRRLPATVLSDAVIDGPITDGHVIIRFPDTPTPEELLELDVLRASLQVGNLPAELIEAQ